jgi:hypothetical protein
MDSTNSARPHLKLVAFDPKDFSIGGILLKDHQTKVVDSKSINAAFSLYFQWNRHCRCQLITADSSLNLEVILEYDKEERQISEIRVKLQDWSQMLQIGNLSTANFRFEIFRQCFEFTAIVVAKSDNPDEGWNFIVTIPENLLVYKQRRMPRINLTTLHRSLLPTAYLLKNGSPISAKPINILEMGMLSIHAESQNKELEEVDGVVFGNQPFKVKLVRKTEHGGIFIFLNEDSNSSNQLFDIYRLIAFPFLKPRREFSHSELAKLYNESGYFGKFATQEAENDRLESIISVWKDLDREPRAFTADYITTDPAGKPTGASSTTLSFIHSNCDIWAFHQLCAVTNPDLLQNTGELYTWRAEYLAGRPEQIDVIGWFTSRSRWLERIYVKFCVQKYNNEDCLFPVSIFRKQVSVHADATFESQGQWTTSLSTRYMASQGSMFGGISPKYLNASDILDSVVALEESTLTSEINQFASQLTSISGQHDIRLEITLKKTPSNLIDDKSVEFVDDTDRFFKFGKSGLVDFLAAVEHSLAVTLEKLKQGEKL